MRRAVVGLALIAIVLFAISSYGRGRVSVATLISTFAIAVAISWKLGRCPHAATVWERRALDGSCRPVPTDEAVFWFVCADCGKSLSQVNQRHPAAPAA
jgi:hypothetical protein